MIGRLLSFWDGLFSGAAMLNFQGVLFSDVFPRFDLIVLIWSDLICIDTTAKPGNVTDLCDILWWFLFQLDVKKG